MDEFPVHLVGSIPLDSTNDVFNLVGRTLKGCCSRIPDGEVGERKNWIGWQFKLFADQDAFIQLDRKDRDYQLYPPFTFLPDYGPEDLIFSDLGFSSEACCSFSLFEEKQAQGVLPVAAKFMVAIPTPFAPVYSFTAYSIQDQVFPVYEEAILSELESICSVVPCEKLSIQWDVATEMSIFEKVFKTNLDDPWAVLIERLARLGEAVPADVDMGYHLCYGSMNNRHWKEPDDLNMCVKVANALSERLSRPINFLHMPVPADRYDDRYYIPLKNLVLKPKTEVFLGLLHNEDGKEGNASRISAASKVLGDFGIAAECGLGRYPSDDVPQILMTHRRVSRGKK